MKKKSIHSFWVSHSENQSHNILAQLKRSHPWNSYNQPSRHLEITLTRLRIGHTRLTHTRHFTHLMPLACPHCGLDPPLSIKHIFKCPDLSAIRTSLLIPHSHLDALSDSSPSLSNMIPFLQHAGFLSQPTSDYFGIHRRIDRYLPSDQKNILSSISIFTPIHLHKNHYGFKIGIAKYYGLFIQVENASYHPSPPLLQLQKKISMSLGSCRHTGK